MQETTLVTATLAAALLVLGAKTPVDRLEKAHVGLLWLFAIMAVLAWTFLILPQLTVEQRVQANSRFVTSPLVWRTRAEVMLGWRYGQWLTSQFSLLLPLGLNETVYIVLMAFNGVIAVGRPVTIPVTSLVQGQSAVLS